MMDSERKAILGTLVRDEMYDRGFCDAITVVRTLAMTSYGGAEAKALADHLERFHETYKDRRAQGVSPGLVEAGLKVVRDG